MGSVTAVGFLLHQNTNVGTGLREGLMNVPAAKLGEQQIIANCSRNQAVNQPEVLRYELWIS